MSDNAQANPYAVYIRTWIMLLVITVAMLVAEKFHMPRWFLVGFLLLFMMVKAVMISGNFMHLRYEHRALVWVVGAGLLVTSLILFFFITPESEHIRENRLKNPVSGPQAPAPAPAH
jgi:cytochrome c oxidase subunit IV